MKRGIPIAIAACMMFAGLVTSVAAFANSSDAHWIKAAASANLLELRAGRLAASRALTPEWRRFGAQMASDHGNALAQLRTLASNEDVNLSAALAPPDQRAYNMLRREHGAAFDASYRRFAVASHVQANALYSHEISHGSDSNVRAVAAKQLPTVQNHLTMADQMTGMSMANLSNGTGE